MFNNRPGERGRRMEEWMRRHKHVRSLDPDLRCAQIKESVYEAVRTRDIGALKREINFDGRLNENNFFEPLKMLLQTEEAHQAVEMRKFDKEGHRIMHVVEPRSGKHVAYIVDLPGQAEHSFLDISDLVLFEDPETRKSLNVRIKEFVENQIVLLDKDFDEEFLNKDLNVYFVSSGIAYQACERALSEFELNANKRRIIFETGDIMSATSGDLATSKITVERPPVDPVNELADSRLARLNLEQRQTVTGILEAKCRPKPYILFGPPGTGKTHTLVEAVAQIFLRSRHARVLFCANSNTCVDQVYTKLRETKVFSETDVVRLRPGLMPSSTLISRIVVTTNIKSANLIQSAPFDYVLIDEAGHAHEPESMIPICSLARDGCLVLAGDPKQLGPVVQFEPAAKNGLESSMLERIIKWDIYGRRTAVGGGRNYDPSYLTKLLDCYRCDPRILAISDKLFYDNELRCLNKTPKSILRIMGLRGPVQMITCPSGQEDQPKMSTSWVNREEINMCVDLVNRFYKMGLEPSQIGIMSPYKLQIKELRKKHAETLRDLSRMLNERFEERVMKVRQIPDPKFKADLLTKQMSRLQIDSSDSSNSKGKEEKVPLIDEFYWEPKVRDWKCKIDTVDSFQGNERDVIIFSPVRSTLNRHLGFLDDCRRFNVAMSRAKHLLVVVGTTKVLESSNYWNEFLCRADTDMENLPRQSRFDGPFVPDLPLFKRGP